MASATSIASKYAALQASQQVSSTQLTYPTDLLSTLSEHPGHVVVFEPNYIKGNTVSLKQDLVTSDNTVSGAYGNEVAMQQSGTNTIRNSQGVASTNKIYSKSNERLVLPMPQHVSASYSANWQTTELGAIGRGLAFMNSAKDGDTEQLKAQIGEAAARTFAGAIQEIGISNAKDYLEITSGVSPNSFVEVLFKGMNNRQMPFTWTMQPRNLAEAIAVKSIINRFKYHMAPEFKNQDGNNSYLLAPSTFDITFLDLNGGANNTWLWKISTCALTQLDVDGTPNGQYAVLKDGAPAACTLSLAFTEMVTLTKADFADQSNSF